MGRDKHSLSSKKAFLMPTATSLLGGAEMNIRIAAIGKEFTAATKQVVYSCYISMLIKLMDSKDCKV